MNADDYRQAATRIVIKDPLTGRITEDDYRRAEILAQLAISAAISENTTALEQLAV